MRTRTRRFAHHALATGAAAVVTYALAALAHTQQVLARLSDIGARIAPADALAVAMSDLIGLRLYAVLIALAMLMALTCAAWLPARWLPLPRPARYALAGGAAMAVMLGAMQLALPFTLIAGSRGALGLALQCASGVAGGLVAGLVSARLARL